MVRAGYCGAMPWPPGALVLKTTATGLRLRNLFSGARSAIALAGAAEVVLAVPEPARLAYRGDVGAPRGELLCPACATWQRALAWGAPGPWRCGVWLGALEQPDKRLAYRGVLARHGPDALRRVALDPDATPERRLAAAEVLAAYERKQRKARRERGEPEEEPER